MNMSEFEGRPQRSMSDLSHSPGRDRQVPGDFSEEELAFAQELEALFPIDEEELPPFYVQTLMASEDPRLQIAEHAFEKKVSARVFRSLKLRRRLFRSSQSPVYVLTSVLHQSRPFVAVSMACLLFMFITMVATSPLFTAGLNYLWTGSHSGVVQVKYPVVSSSPSSPVQRDDILEQNMEPRQLSFEQAQQLLHFQIYWPNYLPPHYNQSDTYLYDADQNWADGPVMVVDFFYSVPGQLPRQLSICEFKPQGDAFRVVQDGAAIKIGQDASPSATYVEGQWKPDGTSSPSWVGRSVIDLRDGLVFWIVGDKLGDIDGTTLSDIARSLRPFDEHSIHLSQVTRAIGEPLPSFGDDVVYLNNPDNPRGPSLILFGAPPALSRVQKNLDSIP